MKQDNYYLIAKWYLILMPIRQILPFHWLRDALPGAALYFDIILHFLGMIILITSNKHKKIDNLSENLFSFFRGMIIWFNISSLIMATVMFFGWSPIPLVESPYIAILGMIIYFVQYVFILYYNKNIIPLFSLKELVSFCEIICKYLFVLGYIQIVVRYIPSLGPIYDSLDVLDILAPDRMVQTKLPLTTAEGSGAGVLIGSFVFPFLFSRLVYSGFKQKYAFWLALWLPIIYNTSSTTCFLLVVINFFVICFLYKDQMKRFLVPAFILAIGVYCGLSLLGSDEKTDLAYTMFDKVTDSENGSTVTRWAPIYMDLEAFINNPIIGCGNGLQGLYAYAIPKTGNTYWLDMAMESNKNVIVNGAVFWPSVLSGYGIIGIILFIIFIVRSYNLVTKKKNILGEFYMMYRLSLVALIYIGMQGEFYGSYYIWFILSIPLMSPKQEHL